MPIYREAALRMPPSLHLIPVLGVYKAFRPNSLIEGCFGLQHFFKNCNIGKWADLYLCRQAE